MIEGLLGTFAAWFATVGSDPIDGRRDMPPILDRFSIWLNQRRCRAAIHLPLRGEVKRRSLNVVGKWSSLAYVGLLQSVPRDRQRVCFAARLVKDPHAD